MKIAQSRERLLLAILCIAMVLPSCQKHDNPKKGSSGSKYSMEDSLKFYTWYYTLSDSANLAEYYWNDQVPALNPFSSQFPNADSLLYGQSGIASYPVVNGKKVDRYSFLDRTGAVSDQIEGGQLGDLGFDIFWLADQNGNTTLWVTYAYQNSPAGKAGVQRGWQITSVNGNTDVSYDGSGYGNGSGDNVNRIINAVYSSSASFVFKKPDGSSVNADLTAAQYNFSPVLYHNVYTVNGTKVGYMVFNSFVDVYTYDNQGNVSGGTPTKDSIDAVFDDFKNNGVKDIIIDLRYNGGGAVSTAEYLDNLIAPPSAKDQVMYTYYFNTEWSNYYKTNNYDLSVKFDNTAGAFSLDNVFFIVGQDTYSASELTINNLKPYMNVKLIGSTTGGKPVGFIPQSIYVVNDTTGQDTHMADLYAINFQTKNSQDQGDYFSGMTPDNSQDDDFTKNWGDTDDPDLKAALTYVETGSFSRVSQGRLAQWKYKNIERTSQARLRNHVFQGMIDYRFGFKKGALPKIR